MATTKNFAEYIRAKMAADPALAEAIEEEMAHLAELDALRAERDKLQAFKSFVHNYLDGVGVPHHPPGTHGAEGCRIGDRMDWLLTLLRRVVGAWLHEAHLGDGILSDHNEVMRDVKAVLGDVPVPARPVT